MSFRSMIAVGLIGSATLLADDPVGQTPPRNQSASGNFDHQRAGDHEQAEDRQQAEDRTAPNGRPKADPAEDNHAAQEDGEKTFDFWMEKKLEYSQAILRGLAIDDLDLVAAKARQMRLLSKVEGWVRKGKPGYTAQLQAFDFANGEIERHARAGDLQAAALGFQQLTTSCVSCHAFLRDPPR